MKIKLNFYRFNVFLALLSIATLLLGYGNDAHATRGDSYKNRAFAGFIKHIYSNVQTVKNGSDLCIFGNDEISLQLKSLDDNKSVVYIGDEIDSKKSYNKCRVIYIAKNKEKESKYSVNFFNDRGSLTIAIFPGFVTDGGMMSIDIGRRNFELFINDVAIKKSGVKINSSIAALIVE